MATTPPAADTTAAKSKDKTADVEVETKEYTVAPRRTVNTEDGDYGPGETVTLSIKEGDKLQKLGFFLNENGAVVVGQGDGPAVVQGDDLPEK